MKTLQHDHEQKNETFWHDAVLYAGIEGFGAAMTSFISESLTADEPVMVMVTHDKIDYLRSGIGADAAKVEFADMAIVGRNPARIIPAWNEFFSRMAAEGRRARGIGEPIWASRTPDELVECHRHEALINLAFSDADAWLICPYDVTTLDDEVLAELRLTHPTVAENGLRGRSERFHLESISEPHRRPLPEPAAPVERIEFGGDSLDVVRSTVSAFAARAGLDPVRCGDLVLAVNEIATNSVRHGRGRGVLRLWEQADTVLCEVADDGSITEPLAGRIKPRTGAEGGFGLWLVNQLCDLVQIRSFPSGSVVRLHMARG